MKRTLVTGFVLLFCLIKSQAQQTLTDTISLKGVEVQTRKPKLKESSAFPLHSLSEIEIKSISGHSVAEVIKNFSGVSLRDYGGVGGLKTILVRSVGSNHTSVFIDGAPLSEIAGGQIDLGKLSLEGLGEVSLSLGNNITEVLPARAYASANRIMLRSKSPDFGVNKTSGSFHVKMGSFGLVNPSLHINQKTSHKSWLEMNFDYLKSRGNYPYLVDNGPAGSRMLFRENSDLTALSAGLKFNVKISDSSRFQAMIRIFDSERGLPGAVVYYNPNSAQRLANKDAALHLEYRAKRKNYALMSHAGWSRAWLRYTDPWYLGYANNLDNRYLQNEYYVSQAMKINTGGNFTTAFATDFIINTFSSSLYNNQNPVRYSLLVAGSTSYQKAAVESTAGLLFSHVKDKSDEDVNAGAYSKLSPYVTFSVKLLQSPTLRFRLMYKQTFRMPSFNELYYNIVGNRLLVPEKAGQANAGLLFSGESDRFGHLQVRADVFSNRVNDKIIAIPTQNLFIWSMKNVGKVNIKGFELQVENTVKLAPDVQLGLTMNYTWQESTDLTDPTANEYKHQIPYIPYETFSGITSLKYKNLSFNYNVLFNGFRYSSGENSQESLLPGWWINDAGFSWELHGKRLKYNFKGEVTNVLNRDYVFIRSFPMPGRSFTITAGIQF